MRLIGAPEKLRRTAEPLDRTVGDAACRRAIADIAAHGWAGFLSLAPPLVPAGSDVFTVVAKGARK
ncbi:hypothetical protein [Streptomyces sp. NPDC006368]|uniref:hypothetical protein n=1 Tax=Streptomyces sp. NPDC006368 TaxID=3156760 RepID=UPI0033BE813C